MAGSQARKNKRAHPVGNEDKNNVAILRATINNLKLSLGANKDEDKILRSTIQILEYRIKQLG